MLSDISGGGHYEDSMSLCMCAEFDHIGGLNNMAQHVPFKYIACISIQN